MGEFSDTPYTERTDAQKAKTQWGKALGLLNRSDWSAAIVRAVTSTEISLNLAIRREHEERGQLSANEVDQLLHNANGISGKLSILEDLAHNARKEKIRGLKEGTRSAAIKRNRIVHSGEFCDEEEARAHIESCRVFVNSLIRDYDPLFEPLSQIARDEIRPDEDPGA